jgi:hypothetical protein
MTPPSSTRPSNVANLFARPSRGAAEPCLPYLAVELPEGVEATRLQALAPRLMRWTETIWLVDLASCEAYWRARARMAGTEVVPLLREILEGVVGDARSASQGSCLRAAMAEHPWPALLLVTHLKERRLSGLVLRGGALGESLYRDVSWTSWWQAAEAFGAHQADVGRDDRGVAAGRRPRLRFDQALFRRQSLQLRRAVRRLGLKSPWQLHTTAAPAMQRRFGATLRDLWLWAYRSAPASGAESALRPTSSRGQRGLFDGVVDANVSAGAGSRSDAGAASPFLSGFPWQSHVFAGLPTVSRDLDDPLASWEHIEPLLREDLDRLCDLPSWQAGELVVSLEWHVVLRDLSRLSIPIRFRHPHPLHLERGPHPTTLLQALYSFESSRRVSHKRQIDGLRDDHEPLPVTPVIVSWQLVLSERLTVPPRLRSLFGGPGSSGEDAAEDDAFALFTLENKLPVPLAGFALLPDWQPEDAFGIAERGPAGRSQSPRAKGQVRTLRGTGSALDAASDSDASSDVLPPEDVASDAASTDLAVTRVARARPLFVHPRPQPFNPRGQSCVWRFLERTMAKWWREEGADSRRSLRELGMTDEAQRELGMTDAARQGPWQRDYYRLTDARHKSYWVYQDSGGRWFSHGVYI